MDFCYFLFLLGFLETKPVKAESLNNRKLLSRGKKKVQYQVYFYNFIHTLCIYVNCTYPSIRKYYSQQGLILQQDHTGFVIKDCGLCCFIPLLPCINLYPTDFMTELTCFMLTTELGQSHSYCREGNNQSLKLFNSLAKESHNLSSNSCKISRSEFWDRKWELVEDEQGHLTCSN